MSERYINNLTGDFSICFSEHLTEHPTIKKQWTISKTDKNPFKSNKEVKL